jgi:hypothetical protein
VGFSSGIHIIIRNDSPDRHLSPTNGLEFDVWAQEIYGYDVLQDGDIRAVLGRYNEKQQQKVSCLKCGKIFTG